MEIGSKYGWPASALSNFAPHKFVLDGVECSSMEGLLQAFKSRNIDVQIERCKLVGMKAKIAGKYVNWQEKQILYWQGKEYKRESKEYQELLNRAYTALAGNESFQKALLSTGDAILTHSIGRVKERETILTRNEFCSRLMKIRDGLRSLKQSPLLPVGETSQPTNSR